MAFRGWSRTIVRLFTDRLRTAHRTATLHEQSPESAI